MTARRLWLILLLAVLLPVRGALAAGMLCPSAPFGELGAQAVEHAHVHAEAGAPGHQHHDASADGHSHADGAAHDHAGADSKCNLCSALCCVAGLVSAGVTIAEPQRAVTVFADLRAPPPSFVSGGQERPPRTI